MLGRSPRLAACNDAEDSGSVVKRSMAGVAGQFRHSRVVNHGAVFTKAEHHADAERVVECHSRSWCFFAHSGVQSDDSGWNKVGISFETKPCRKSHVPGAGGAQAAIQLGSQRRHGLGVLSRNDDIASIDMSLVKLISAKKKHCARMRMDGLLLSGSSSDRPSPW